MDNRLPLQQWLLLLLIIVGCTLSFSTVLTAQNFTINYTGPDTIFTDNTCTATLDWGHPNTISFTADNGNDIDTFYINNISGGYQIGDVIRAARNTFVNIDYYVEDVTGESEIIRTALRLLIRDTIRPIFNLTTLPRDTSYSSLGNVPLPPSISTIMASDNCGVETIRYNGEGTRPAACGQFTRTWEVLDTADNSTIYIQTITIVEDETAPVWTSNPTDINYDCNIAENITDTISNWLTANGNGTITDASNFTVTHDFIGLDSCGITGDAVVIFTATDECGNTSTATGNINVRDTIQPIINLGAKDTTVNLSNPSVTLAAWLAAHGYAMATDFCTTIDNSDTSTQWTVASIDTVVVCSNNIDYEATFVVTDACGNMDSTMATYTVIDNAGLNVSGIHSDTTETCGADIIKTNQWFIRISAKDVFDQNGTKLKFNGINYKDRDGVEGTWFGIGDPFNANFIPINDCNWYLDAVILYRDTCGQEGRDTARISFFDTIAPILTNIPLDTTVSCGEVPIASIEGINATDNCDTGLTITVTEIMDTTLSSINITRMWTATDDCNNSVIDTQLITVIDTVAPVLTDVPNDTISTCDDIPFSFILLTATDNCTLEEDLFIDFFEDDDQGTHPDSCQTYNYTITRTWIVVDAFNNADTSIQIITVVDTLAPTFTMPADVTVSCELRDDITITGQPTNLSDDCDTAPDFSFVDLVIGGDCVGSGVLDTIIRTWTVRDACGNSSDSTQQIILIDTTAPVLVGLVTDITIQCNGDTIPVPVIGTDITATDNCSDSPIIQYLGETNTRSSDPNTCEFYNYSILRTWRVTDACSNTAEFTQSINIVDTIAPTIICPLDMVVESDTSLCGQNITLPKPFYFDDCTGTTGRDSLSLTQHFTNAAIGDINEVPVDTLVFNFNIGSIAPNKIITSEVRVTINLNGVDGEGANEIFSIVGEDGTVFAGTNPAASQCGNSTTTIILSAAIANEYAKDSVITLLLGANGTGTEAINNICTDGNAQVSLEYDFEMPATSITLTYKVDGGAIANLDTVPMATFEVGSHLLTYYATDCSGNQDSCTFQLTIADKIAPTFDCPTGITTYTDSNSCEASVVLPFPTNFADNCGAFDNFDRTIAAFLTFRTDANAGQVPNDLVDTFGIANPNAIGDGVITVSFLGDNRDTGEFFNIYGENGVLLGTTILGDSISECATNVTTTFTINKDTLNAWAADGNIIITAKPNLDAANFTDFINPCQTNLTADFTDGSSVLSINLNFPTVIINYSIADSNDVLISTGMLLAPTIPVSQNFAIGTSRVTYRIEDAAGNTAACLYTVEVKDSIAPVIICRDDFVVQTNPVGDVTDLSTMVDSLVLSMSDNCEIDSIIISPSEISCADTGMTTVTITAIDKAGNSATCQSTIAVITETLIPTFSVGVCDDDALFLFADSTFQTPISAGASPTYNWVGPNSFTATDANPVIPNVGVDNSGIYTLTMTGETGCTATGTLFVNISNVDAPLINAESNTVCQVDGITLTTSAVNCTDLEYQWYEIVTRDTVIGDTVILVGTSIIPSFSIENPTAGRHAYYLIVECVDCSSLGSQVINITVFDVPPAVTSAAVVNICEGESIALASPLTDQTCTYSWVGPGFTADLPTPAPILNATKANEGIYTLRVSKNGCTSEEAFTVVSITDRPTKPSIINDSGTIICEGSPLVLKTDILNANTYTWTNTSSFATFTTTAPELRIDTANITDAGKWTVSVEAINCSSEPSEVIDIQIENKPNGTAFFAGAACEGSIFQLNVNPIIAGAGYEWTAPDGTTYFGTNPEVPVAAEYILTITSVNGCKTTKTLPIDVKTTPIITTLFDSGDAAPCIIPDDTNVRLIADVFPANDGTYTYTWITPNGTEMPPIPDSILVIPNAASSEVNGTYALVVKTGDGCQSNQAINVVDVTDIPVPNPVITANSTTLCEGQTLILTATEYPTISAEYRWQITSIMDTITQSPVLILDAVTTALNGVVSLQVYNDECPSVGTATLAISVNSLLAQPEINPLDAFCAGEAITLTTAAVSGATYLWEGPNFTATSSTPNITITANANLEDNGGYTLQILSNGCTSPRSEPLIVSVNAVSNAPIANNSGDICIANSSDIILFIDEEDIPAGTEFTWYNAANEEIVAGPNMFKSQILEVSNFPAGTYQFYATQRLNGCESAASNITALNILEIPTELAQVCDGDMTICDADNAVICAQAPAQGTGIWTTEAKEIIIANPNQPQTAISGLRPGSTYTFFWTLSNGVCGEYSATRLIVDVGVTIGIAKVCTPIVEECEGNEVNLCANPVPAGFSGQWSQPSSQAALGVTIDNPVASNTIVSSIEPGNPYNAYTFYWTVVDEAGTCTATDTMMVQIFGLPDELAMIEDTELISCNGEAVVTAISISEELTGIWTSPNDAIIINDPNSSSTSISNLDRGMNTLIWSLTSGACAAYSADEIIVFYEAAPITADDVFDIGFSSEATLNVVENDEIFSPEFDLTILSAPMHGTAEVQEDGPIKFVANQGYVGLDVFTYELCNPTCASDCSIAEVTLDIGKKASCIIPTIMTPNSDGINDFFMIPCIETGNFPGNEVTIFNQWGDEIYRAAPYTNNWQGTYNGEDVPAGTYYYVISFDRNSAPEAGFLVIER